MEGVLLAGLLVSTFEGHDVGVLLAVVPVVDNVVAGHDHVSLRHGDMLGLNRDGLALDGAAYSVAEDDVPLILNFLVLGNQDAVLITTGDPLKTFHVLNVLLVDRGVPEDDTHIITLRLAEGEDKGASEVAPHVVGLDVGEKDIGVDGESDSETISFPCDSVDHTCERWHSE